MSKKGSAPDQMDIYLENIASVVGPDYSLSTSAWDKGRGVAAEPVGSAGDCFRAIYLRLALADVADTAVLRQTIDAVTGIDKAVQRLAAPEPPAADVAQATVVAIRDALDALVHLDAETASSVKDCLASSLPDEWRAQLGMG